MLTYRYGNPSNNLVEIKSDQDESTIVIPVDINNSDYAKLISDGVTIEPYVAPITPPPTTPTVIAIAELKVVDEEFVGIETSTGLAAAMFIDTGLAWVFFLTPQPNVNYLTFVQSSGCNVDITDRQEDYFEVTITDRATNQPVTPTNLSISVQRMT